MFIYKITNKLNEKCYIGLDTGKVEEQKRWKAHCYNRRQQKFTIQCALFKHGIENFSYDVIDYATTKEELIEKERYWIKYYDTIKNGYNSHSGGNGGHFLPEDKEERRKILHERNIKRWNIATEKDRQEHAQKVSASISVEERQKRRKRALAMWANPERAAKQAEAMKQKTENRRNSALKNLAKINKDNQFCKTYEITFPDGTLSIIKNLSQFCRDHQISYGCMLMLTSGRLDHYRDWQCKKII